MRLFIEGSSYRPSVLFDVERGYLRIDGVSNMPDSAQFYGSLIAWLMEHKDFLSPNTRLMLRLLYLNSGSYKALFHFFDTVARMKLPIRVILIHSSRYDNSDEVALLVQICRQVGLIYEAQEEGETAEEERS